MDIIKNRIVKLRNELNEIPSNRKKINYLRNYYSNKTAIIVATGPGFADHINLIKDSINENTILICIKQSINHFDMIADFHILNQDHIEQYNYNTNYKPIVLFINYSKPRKHNFRSINATSDINFFLWNLNGVSHKRKNGWDLLNTDIDFLTFNDDNLGEGENMVINMGHIMMELTLPLAVSIGVKNIILNGFVGGGTHGTLIKNELSWNTKEYKFLYAQQETFYEMSKYLEKYLFGKFGIHICSICKTNYHIRQIDADQYINIINN